MDCGLPGPSVHGDSPGKNTGVGYHALLQEIVPTQGLNPGLPHWVLYQLSHRGSPGILEWVVYPFSRNLPNPGLLTKLKTKKSPKKRLKLTENLPPGKIVLTI